MTCLEKLVNFICCVDKPIYPDPYNFSFNGNNTQPENIELFQTNFVRTSKYTILSFLPKGLFVQFKRIANVYFLMIAILQSIPVISPLNVYTAWIPLIIVLAISMLRQGYEDYQRYKSDKQMNFQSITNIRRNGKFEEVQWSKVVVGDVCLVRQQELFPADLILLTTSSQNGVGYIETASLDGQKNLKPRNAYPKTQLYSDESRLDKMRGQLRGDIPSNTLEKFSSTMVIDGQTIVYDGIKQLLYRGTRLKNTKWVYGLAIYTGKNTKIMLNSQLASQKMSQIEVKVNKILIFIFLIQIALCFIIAIFYGVFRNNYRQTHTYILWNDYSVALDSFLIFLTYIVLINTMIPISLIVSIQIVKFSQSYFINNDKLMYSSYRKKFVQVKSASLNEELGQIQYIFSDKTGTLTKNIMEFKIATIGTKMYGDLSLISQNQDRADNNEKGFKDDKLANLINGKIQDQNINPSISICNKNNGDTITFRTAKDLAEEYFKILSLAHQVVVETDKKGKNFYQAKSPDQIALVDAAKAMGYEFIKSNQNSSTVKIKGVQKNYQILEIFPFSSQTKRMTIVLKQNGVIKMYMKGADNVVKNLLAKNQAINLDKQLSSFSRVGLRTLLVAARTVSQDEYQKYRIKLQALPANNKQVQFNKLREEFENGMYLVGATAVLDRLQDDVPETIRDMLRANIKVWMLTGDKMETAQNIAKSCNLIQSHFQVLKYQPPHNASQQLKYIESLVAKATDLTSRGIQKAFLIQGLDLVPIILSNDMQIQLARLAENCEAVVGCRLQPIQKAQVVALVRKHLNKITLSIGDGSNDVPMIKTAHIGVGLFGQEGMGAVQASDYAMPEFRMLWRLLLVHGRWNYIRISEMILYFFYKNMLFTLPQFILGFYCGYSGQTMFDDFYITLYNLAFTSLPLIIRAVFEQDVNYVYREQYPKMQNNITSQVLPGSTFEKQNSYLPKQFKINKYLYRLFPKIYFIGQQNLIFNYFNYSMWVLEGIVESILISFFTIYIIGNLSVNQNGYNSDWWIVGLTIFSAVILVVTIKLATHTKFWSLVFILIMIFSLCLYGGYTWLSNYYLSDYINGTAYLGWISAETYFLVLFCVCLVLTIDGIVLSLDYQKGGYASKMRQAIQSEQLNNPIYFEEMSLRISDNLSQAPGKK